MGNIHRPSSSGGRGPDTGAFIQFVDGREPQIHELWCHVIGGICHKVHLYERIEILYGTFGKFVTE